MTIFEITDKHRIEASEITDYLLKLGWATINGNKYILSCTKDNFIEALSEAIMYKEETDRLLNTDVMEEMFNEREARQTV
jgi:hypothetical protein